MARRLDLPNSVRGVMVTKVNDDEGELRTGDVIEEVNQQPVTSVAEYKKVVSSLDPNEHPGALGLPASHPFVRRLASQVAEAASASRGLVGQARAGHAGAPNQIGVNNRRSARV